MALTTPKMSLSVWNQLTDPYDHAQLADNWSKVDFHDHTPGRGVLIPTEGIADGAVTAAKLASTLDPSLGYAVYKDILRGSGNLTGATANTYPVPWNGAANLSTGAQPTKPIAFYIDLADYAVTGRSTVLRIRFSILVNNTAPTINFVAGLYPISTYGGVAAETSLGTLGTVTSGSTATINTPAAGPGAIAPVVSSDFAFPSAGWYVLGIAASGAQAANSHVTTDINLQVRQV